MPSKGVISIRIDGSNKFLKACGIGKLALRNRIFSRVEVSVDVVIKKLHEDIK